MRAGGMEAFWAREAPVSNRNGFENLDSPLRGVRRPRGMREDDVFLGAVDHAQARLRGFRRGATGSLAGTICRPKRGRYRRVLDLEYGRRFPRLYPDGLYRAGIPGSWDRNEDRPVR